MVWLFRNCPLRVRFGRKDREVTLFVELKAPFSSEPPPSMERFFIWIDRRDGPSRMRERRRRGRMLGHRLGPKRR
jgi:hypothetical protein